jgi:hypothetical protein
MDAVAGIQDNLVVARQAVDDLGNLLIAFAHFDSVRTGENVWKDGEVYNPDNGENYRARMSMEKGGSLRIRAYLLLPLFGHTLIWTRVK